MKQNLTRYWPMALVAIACVPTFAHAAEEAAPEGSWLGTLFFAINFILFVAIIYKFAGPMLGSYFRDRASGIRSQLNRMNTALMEAQDLANRAAKMMAEVETESAQLKTEIDHETAFIVNRIREGARATAERIRRDTNLSSAALLDAAQRRVRERLAANAASIARQLIEKTFAASDQSRLVDNFMEKIRNEAAQ